MTERSNTKKKPLSPKAKERVDVLKKKFSHIQKKKLQNFVRMVEKKINKPTRGIEQLKGEIMKNLLQDIELLDPAVDWDTQKFPDNETYFILMALFKNGTLFLSGSMLYKPVFGKHLFESPSA